MKNPIKLVVIAAICALAPGCSQTPEPAPTTTVTVVTSTGRPPATAPAPPPSPTPGIAVTPTPSGAPGADGSTGNDVSPDYCAQNEDPGCPVGSYVGPDAIPNPNGDGSYVPCEGTICTNPNHGAGPDPESADAGGDIPEPGQDMESP